MSESRGAVVYWTIDGEDAGLGYFQRWAIPVPGDLVRFDPRGGDVFYVRVTERLFTQPELDHPHIDIRGKREEFDG